MIILTNDDFERLGKQAAAEFERGVPLNDSIYKMATDMGLAPAQIKGVVWSANTAVQLELFSKQAEDRMSEFPVASAEYIVNRLYTPIEQQPLPVVAEKMAMDFFSPPVEQQPVTEKTAGELSDLFDKPVSAASAGVRKAKKVISMRKAAHELEQCALVARELYVDKVGALAWRLRQEGGLDEFEKDAFALHGEDIIPILKDLREGMHNKESVPGDKLAADKIERVVDASDPRLTELEKIKQAFHDAVDNTRALTWLHKQLEGTGTL